jgi:fido (protein-threonine AMPylation protein)
VLDTRTWVDAATHAPDEIAVRFHHRLVAVHPFPSGNGRLSRVAADYLIAGLGNMRFSWGAGVDRSTDDLRRAYGAALQSADGGDIVDLIAFARR